MLEQLPPCASRLPLLLDRVLLHHLLEQHGDHDVEHHDLHDDDEGDVEDAREYLARVRGRGRGGVRERARD